MTTASIETCDRIRDDIVAGSLSLGSRLKLDLLSDRYSVGHMPIREALRQLQGEGLIVLTPNRGARVRAVDIDFVRNIFDLRIAIESMLARRAAERIDEAQLARLERIQDSYDAKARVRDYKALLAINREFHTLITAIAGNPEAAAVLERHWSLIAALWNRYGYGTTRPLTVSGDHRQLIGALASHEADVAASLAMAHAARAKQALVARMESPEPGAARERPGRK